MKFSYNTVIGFITLEEDNGEIVRISFGKECGKIEENNTLAQAFKEIDEYLKGERKYFTFPYRISGTEFQKKVYRELLKIPYGETRTYKDIALSIGNEKACRAVGNANNKNKLPIIVPCHRVIGSNNDLTGYAGGLNIKKYLLNLENK